MSHRTPAPAFKTVARLPVLTKILVALAVAGIVATSIVAFVTLQARVDALAGANVRNHAIIAAKDDQLATILDKYSQLYSDCEDASTCTSTAPAPEVIQEILPTVAGPQGATGASGRDGRSPTDAEVALAIAVYCAAHADCQGPLGPAGVNGTNGINGTDGATGAAGQDGTDGRDGVDGQPPASWTYQDAFGIAHTCTRDVSSDQSSPTYSCA